MRLAQKSPDRWMRTRMVWTPLRIGGVIAVVFAVAVGRIGFLHREIVWIQDLYLNVAVDLAGIAIALLVIEVLSERRARFQLNSRLIREMGSPGNGIALRAIVELEAQGWTKDGSLVDASFYKAYLEGAWLDRTNLR